MIELSRMRRSFAPNQFYVFSKSNTEENGIALYRTRMTEKLEGDDIELDDVVVGKKLPNGAHVLFTNDQRLVRFFSRMSIPTAFSAMKKAYSQLGSDERGLRSRIASEEEMVVALNSDIRSCNRILEQLSTKKYPISEELYRSLMESKVASVNVPAIIEGDFSGYYLIKIGGTFEKSVKAYNDAVKNETTRIRGRLEHFQNALEKKQASLAAHKKALEDLLSKKDQVFTREYMEKILSMFNGVSPEGHLITDHIFITYGDTEYDLGQFAITFYNNGTVKVLPYLGNKHVSGIYHPHISGGGSPCLGNMNEYYVSSYNSKNLFGMIEAVLLVLNNYDHRNPYRPIYGWPKAKPRSASE